MYLGKQIEMKLAILKQNGIVTGIPGLDDMQMHALLQYLKPKLAHNAHVRAKGSDVALVEEALRLRHWPAFSVSMQDIVLAPYLFELILAFHPLAEAYFEEPAYLYSMNAFWTQPTIIGAAYKDTHEWHRDTDDRKQMVVFVYGSDVLRPECGVHLYQIGTHNTPDDKLGRAPHLPPPHLVRAVGGVAGSVFIEDTRGLHMARRPVTDARLLFWGRFGVSKPPASYIWDDLRPVPKALLGERYPTDAALREAISLVVA